jgi:4-oxalocrotonate tautomerase
MRIYYMKNISDENRIINMVMNMPLVELKILGKITKEQKAEITRQFTETLRNVAGKPPEYTYVIINEIGTENWGHKGELFADK